MIPFDHIIMVYQRWAKMHHRLLYAKVFNIPGTKRWSVILVHDKRAK